ncbi:cobalamin B12-binding domain-containing protein [Neobacillus mesonae]|uniref:cobalamin B12-binding domain-containing protein n=1 Tax=Neobacillus mesonae TaxID=1193713 RepID=UPI0020402649|nr:cobalamin B12-binding domain-containing protein [Neobacillus mesonae]MCM3566947.1 cobalamin B12-binding domain-containing protein [Neobacillus mesonae]
MGNETIKVLIAKAGLDGHDRGAKVIARTLMDAGMEVIYGGLRQSPEQIVETALQEDVDVIGISLLSGAHMKVFPRILELMKEKGIEDKILTGGGTILPEEIEELKQLGVDDLFGPDTSLDDITTKIQQLVYSNRKNVKA